MPEARTLTLTARKPLADGVNTEPIQVVLTKANVPGDGQATPIANPKPTSCELITNETLPSRSATEPFLVWKGTLKRSDEAQVTRVVCKIALKFNRAPERLEDLFQMYPKQPSTALSALEKEAGLYCGELKVLQGEVVPRFYGYYKGKIARCDINSGGGRNHPGSTLEGFEEAMACIILEDGGENVPEELLKEDPLIVDTVIDAFFFFPTVDVVRDQDGNIRIVGFSRAQKGHECELEACFHRDSLDCRGRWQEFGCEGMYEIANWFDWLTPGGIGVKWDHSGIFFIDAHATDVMERVLIPPPEDNDMSKLSAEEMEERTITKPAAIRKAVERHLAIYGHRDPKDVLRHYPVLKAKGVWPPVIVEAKAPTACRRYSTTITTRVLSLLFFAHFKSSLDDLL
ncbi:hypothetical protein BDY19DRAFT_970119 [Irpex rosettiformis]|uniref:Uncharacterized protein n=1 Tax=Irpex rosettiformis TaxID=378272 RepID=A0ACB8TRB1_9APHY|nr:hypothetical protein BDY19DRAFT_970119 [Irpex rosettiformis]